MPMIGDKYAYSPDLVLFPAVDRGSSGRADGFLAMPVANTVGQMILTRKKEAAPSNLTRAHTYHFRTGDTLPPSETKEMLSSYGPHARVFIKGHIDVLTSVKAGELRLLGSLREGDGGSTPSVKKQGQDRRSICSVVSIQELSEFQRRNPQVDIYLRAGLFGGATLNIDPTTQSSSPPPGAASSLAHPSDSFIKYQLPVSLWKEIICTFRHPHGSSFQDYHHQSHRDDGNTGFLQYVSTSTQYYYNTTITTLPLKTVWIKVFCIKRYYYCHHYYYYYYYYYLLHYTILCLKYT